MLAQGSRKRSQSQAGMSQSRQAPPVLRVARPPRKPLSKRVARLEKINKKQQKSRCVKELSNSFQAITYAAPVLVKFTAQQGNGPAGYINSEAFAQSAIFSMTLLWNSRTANLNNNQIRILIGFIRHDGAAATAGSVCTDLFGTATPFAHTQYVYRHFANTEGLGSKYIIKYDKVHNVNTGVYWDATAALATTEPATKTFKEIVSFKNVKMEWDASQHGGVNPPEYNCPFILFISNNNTGAHVAYQYRQWFTHEAVV